MSIRTRYTLRFSGAFESICEVFDGNYHQVVATFYNLSSRPLAERMVKRLNRK